MSKLRLGVLGGTFDPIHNGHLFAANEIAEILKLDQVLFVPTGQPWQKSKFSDAKHRLKMAALGIKSNKKFRISDVDVKRSGATYTVDTLTDLKNKYPDAELFFIVGADSLAGMESWKDIDKLWGLAQFVAITRPGYSLNPPKSPVGAISAIEIPGLAISASQIRERVKAGLSIEYLVPKAVRKYIDKHNLYRGNK